MKVLLVDDDERVRLLFGPVIENTFKDVDLLMASTSLKAIEILKKYSDVELVICDYEMPEGNGDLVYQYIIENNRTAKFVLHTSQSFDATLGFDSFPRSEVTDLYIQKPCKIKSFKKLIMNFMNQNEMDSEFAKIRLAFFWRFNKCLCDVYLKLSEKKYIKILNANEVYSKDLLDKLTKYEHRYLYIKSKNLENFLEKGFSKPYLIDDPVSEVDRNTIATTHAIIHDLALSVGIGKKSIELADSIAQKIIENVSDNAQLSRLFLEMKKAKDYLYDHSYLVSIVCCEICRKIDWQDEQKLTKLCYASIFHDIELQDSKLAMINDLNGNAYQKLTSEQRDLVANHSIMAAKRLAETSGIPEGVDRIVLFHHEKPKGNGFPKKIYSSNIPPLARIFVLAHDFVDELYAVEFDENRFEEVLNKLAPVYFSDINFKKYFRVLKEVVPI